MRELITEDVFKMSKILKKMDIKLDVEGKTQNQVGADLILKIGENLHLAEKEVNEFMASLTGMSPKDFSMLPITKTFEYFEEFKNLPGLAGFFKFAGKVK